MPRVSLSRASRPYVPDNPDTETSTLIHQGVVEKPPTLPGDSRKKQGGSAGL